MREHSITFSKTNISDRAGSVLATLRALLPARRLGLAEALQVAELQASYLVRLRDISGLPVPVEIVTGLPRITIEYDPDLPRHAASGVSMFYDGVQQPPELAELFAVSRRAMEVRLDQLGLTESAEQLSPVTPSYRIQPRRSRPPYHRPLSLHRPLTTATPRRLPCEQ